MLISRDRGLGLANGPQAVTSILEKAAIIGMQSLELGRGRECVGNPAQVALTYRLKIKDVAIFGNFEA